MYIRISNVGKYRDKTVPNYEPHHAAPKALFYELDGSGSPGLGKARTVANHNSLGYGTDFAEISIADCNRLSSEGKHRNLERIKAACNKIGQSIDLQNNRFSFDLPAGAGSVVVQSGGSKKTKKNQKYNKILNQKGGVLVIPSRTPLGSDLSRINDVDLKEYLTSVSIPVFIADMDGDNIYEMKPPTSAVLVMGNEANGISNSIKQIVSTKISIPRYGNSQLTESLNVATATAILLSEFRR